VADTTEGVLPWQVAGLDRPVDIRYSKITFLRGFEFGK